MLTGAVNRLKREGRDGYAWQPISSSMTLQSSIFLGNGAPASTGSIAEPATAEQTSMPDATPGDPAN
jgi:hypothetical protein